MKNLSIVATFVANPEQKEAAKVEMLKLIEPTRNEDGCLKYELYSDNENENTFVFQEVWQSDAHLEKHTQSGHFTSFIAATEGMFATCSINKLTLISNK